MYVEMEVLQEQKGHSLRLPISPKVLDQRQHNVAGAQLPDHHAVRKARKRNTKSAIFDIEDLSWSHRYLFQGWSCWNSFLEGHYIFLRGVSQNNVVGRLE